MAKQIVTDEINAWFALTMKNLKMKDTVEYRVDIVAAPNMRGIYIYIYIYIYCLFIT
jgi:hypothetical protein